MFLPLRSLFARLCLSLMPPRSFINHHTLGRRRFPTTPRESQHQKASKNAQQTEKIPKAGTSCPVMCETPPLPAIDPNTTLKAQTRQSNHSAWHFGTDLGFSFQFFPLSRPSGCAAAFELRELLFRCCLPAAAALPCRCWDLFARRLPDMKINKNSSPSIICDS